MLPAFRLLTASLSQRPGLMFPASARRSWMRAGALSGMLCLLSLAGLVAPAGAAESVPALTRTDRNAIQAVINLQLKAIASNDEAGAFALTAPDVRRQFGTAEAFMEMVREGYPPLLRNQSTAFLEASIVNDDVIQPLRIVNRDGSVVIALFSMERQANGDWRVYGCQLTPSDLQAA